HYLEEAEAFASRVVIISRGRIVADGSVARLKRRAGLWTVRFATADPQAPALEHLAGLHELARQGERVTVTTTDADATVRDLPTGEVDWHDLEVHSASLEDVFVSLVDHAEEGGSR